jgi:predicted NBD/HSP70 family sugar kinase
MATPEDARRANRSHLLRRLHRDGPLSRADLAKITGLTRASVSAVVRDLMDDGVVEELGLSTTGGVGKPATLVDIDADGRHVLCLDLSEPAHFVGAIVNLAGKIVARRTYDRKGKTGRAAANLVVRMCRDLVADAERPLLGIGIASPGIVDGSGVIVTAAHFGWTSLPLAADLSAQFDLPVRVVNDANAAALAELTFGEQPATNLICVRVDEGVGAGLVLDGRLYTGSSFAAGEIGHVVVDPDGTLCACGKRGCLETEVSEPLLERRLEAEPSDGVAVLSRAGEHLGTALATVLSALDVADVVLSGSGPVASETFRLAAVRAISERTMPVLSERLVVRASTFGFDDVLVGAAARVLDSELGIR